MTQSKPSLIDELITFIENERELYGPFSVSTGVKKKVLPDKSGTQNVNDSDEPNIELPQETEKNAEGKIEETNSEHSTSDPATEELGYTDAAQENSKKLIAQLDECSSLEELWDLCEAADELYTDLDNTNLVFGVGNPDADLMIVGEAPGFNEDQQGEPFVGAAGKLLNKILQAIQFEREDVYIANILKHRPPDNRNPTREERNRSLPYLERQIDLVSPKVILCVGKVAGTTLLGRDDALKRMRGQFYDYRDAKLTVTYHPAALLRNPRWKRPVWEDVQKVRKKYDELNGNP